MVSRISFGPGMTLVTDSLERTLNLCIALWVITKDGRQMIGSWFRLTNRNYFLLALGSCSAAATFAPIAMFLYQRAYWAAFEYGKTDPPELTDYFILPTVSVVTPLLAAVLEEVIFRGFLQPQIAARYGVMRGLFLTGMVWSAIHFRFDPYPRYSDAGILLHLTLRIVMCLALSFVFGWLTLKSRSIFPAMLAHMTINFLANCMVSLPMLPGQSQWVLQIILWAILAYALFRYWPPESEPKTLPVIGENEAAPTRL
jgi:membrane protease YdiL (CAAX protease family)